MDLIYKQLCINVCVNRAYEHFTHTRVPELFLPQKQLFASDDAHKQIMKLWLSYKF